MLTSMTIISHGTPTSRIL